jgi:DNA polymerase
MIITENPDRVAEWLQYFADLGISFTYRDRVAGPNSMGKASAAQMGKRPGGNGILQSLAHQPNAQVATMTKVEPNKRVTGAAVRSSAATPLVIPSASLFDVADRVEDDTLEKIRETIGDCHRCRLSERRTNIVFGVGNPKAQLVFIGEGPGRDEDIQGEPFVGRAGKLLTQMIQAMSLRREDVYICNVVKCRPPENRAPEKDEMATCSPFLFRQLDVIRPKAIVCLGAIAVQALLGAGVGITKTRGQWFDFRGSRLMPTYHPAYLLRNPAAKAEVWKDLQQVMAFLGLEPARANLSSQPRA